MHVVVQGLLTGYQRSGPSKQAKQVVILHGWGDNSAGWLSFAAGLDKSFEVIVPDLPGFGASQNPETIWGLNEYAEFVAAFIAKLKLKPYAIIGHSNGGAIAIRGIAHGALAPKKLILLASAGIRGESSSRNKALLVATKAGKFLTKPLPHTVRRRLQKKVYQAVGSDMLVAEHLKETFKQVVSDDVRADAAKITIPTLLVYGEDDPAAPVRYGRLFHEAIDGSMLEILPHTDHFLHLQHPAMVHKLTKEFLA